MTAAICFKCGEFKFGAWTACQKCGALPETDDDRVLSLAMTDHYFDQATLGQMGEAVKRGEPPHLDPRTHENLLRHLHETDLSIPALICELKRQRDAVIGKKPWWKFW
jgi:hypothetical protein